MTQEAEHVKAHVADYKKEVVNDIIKLIDENPIVGVVNMENLPAPQLQAMRSQLRGKFYLTMTKRRLIKMAFEKTKSKKKGIEQLEPLLYGMPALIFTKENPFKLSRTLQRNKSPAPAKAGQTAPKDIVVHKGATPFAPGPIIGELAMAGIKSGVEGGKVAIKEDTIVVRAGERIKPKVAEILTRLGIQPMEVGLDLVAVYENGLIYKRDILAIDEKEYLGRLSNAARWAFNLSVEAGYPTKDNISTMLGKAFSDAKVLGVAQNIIDEGIIDELLGKAQRQMNSLSSEANFEVSEKKSEAKAPEPEIKKEEKPEEVKVKEKESEAKSQSEEKKEDIKVEEKKPEEKPNVAEKAEDSPKAQGNPGQKESSEKAPAKKELGENIKKREKEKEQEHKEIEKIAQDIQKKAIKDQK